MTPVFDGHNDVLLRLIRKSESDDGVKSFLEGDGEGQLDLPRSREGGMVGGLFAIFIPTSDIPFADAALMEQPEYDLPLAMPSEFTFAQGVAVRMASLLHRIARRSEGAVHVCRSVEEIRAAVEGGTLASVMHMEGAEPIDRDFRMLEVLYEAGLRSIGPVWSRPNIFAHGVPFRYPSTPDTGPGLTDEGKALIRICNEMRIAIDLSHINEKGFWDVAELSDAPLIASHSNAHAICPHARNLTDRQLDAIRETNGLVGINYAAAFLRPDGRMIADTPLETVVRHADHLIEHLGEDGVGLGSDFDGAVIPNGIGTVLGLPNLVEAFRSAGYGDELLAKICFGNWLRVLETTWGE